GTDRAAPFVRADIERDTGAALDLRAQLTLGVHDRLFDNGVSILHGFAGLGAAYEDWDATALEDREHFRAPSGESKETDRELSMQLRLRYSRAILKTGAVDGDIVVYPSLTDLGDFRARSEAAFTLPVMPRLKLRLNLRLDYDSDPGLSGLDEWGASVGAGFRWDF
ncbi:MAG TPA: DUF481 domain-containing protein, partial [Candidatus Hydrogenedentes bacterium]|nr:DUF481 domain-containing protein [Candidatus Hydrogenedentota bacterium]